MNGPGHVTRRVVVHGMVQGVFFRDTCRREAQARGIAGWVSNRGDGAVEALFSGTPDAVEEMVAWARSGPPRAMVERVDVQDGDPPGNDRFEVR